MKQDIYQTITNNIIEALETIEESSYKAPFAHLTGQDFPLNPMTSNYYHGINTVVLWFAQFCRGYSCNEWGTFKQWKEKGAQVKKGEKSTMIIFYKRVEKQEDGTDESTFYNMIRSYNVFNADQVEGYTPSSRRENDRAFGTVEKLEAIEQYIQASGAKVIENQSTPCFIPKRDEIHMIRKDVFFEEDGQSATENYYAVLLHELTHWTGGKKRLDREQLGHDEDLKSYAFEELIAELGSAFLCSKFNIKQHGRDDHAHYIKSWLKALRSDKKYIFKASAQAQQAVNFLDELAEDKEKIAAA